MTRSSPPAIMTGSVLESADRRHSLTLDHVIKRVLVALCAATVLTSLVSCSPEASTPSGPACSPANPPEDGTTRHRIEFQGEESSYLRHLPPGYDGRTRLPVVMLFHGLGDDAEGILAWTRMDELADTEDAIVVVPEGDRTDLAWDFSAGADDPDSDVSFAHAVLERVKDTTCVDERRVYAAGFSNGSTLTLALACEASHDFAAFGAVSGPYYAPRCDSSPPRPIIYFHGANDLIIPYGGARTVIGDLPGVTETLTYWAEHNECDSPARTSRESPDIKVSRWTGCASDSDVSAYLIDGGDHTWPGGFDGPGSGGIKATELMWEFFSEHALLP
jgi:polyhydroxybutyrate depolymerase